MQRGRWNIVWRGNDNAYIFLGRPDVFFNYTIFLNPREEDLNNSFSMIQEKVRKNNLRLRVGEVY